MRINILFVAAIFCNPMERQGFLERITGGEEVPLTNEVSYEWIANIVSVKQVDQAKFGLQCGGSLINRNTILTAAHCVHNYTRFHIRTGNLNLDGGSSSFIIWDVITANVHEDYNPYTLSNDIATLHVRMRYDNDTMPKFIRRATMNDTLIENTELDTAGWGVANINAGALSPVLKWVKLTFYSPQDCITLIPTDLKLLESQMCAGSTINGQDSCRGDRY